MRRTFVTSDNAQADGFCPFVLSWQAIDEHELQQVVERGRFASRHNNAHGTQGLGTERLSLGGEQAGKPVVG
jgi:hypothetical protein